jgi:hypothetical protein
MKTERKSRPDFIFPSADAYRNEGLDASKLAMVAAKTTCKDRWRQILAEADRLPLKHLLTLEPGISVTQTDEMIARNVVLVVPRELHNTFTDNQRRHILTMRAFLDRTKNLRG